MNAALAVGRAASGPVVNVAHSGRSGFWRERIRADRHNAKRRGVPHSSTPSVLALSEWRRPGRHLGRVVAIKKIGAKR